MDIVIALVFISLMLVIGALVFFLSRMGAGDFDHGDRLSLLPLAEDERERRESIADEDEGCEAVSEKKGRDKAPPMVV